jgi:hypothetical protein
VRVLDEDQLDPEGSDDDQPTDVGVRFECPVCGSQVAGADFRVETAGEVWTGDAAVWAEEGVCSDCYREVVNKDIREWSPAEWLVHHYEGWHRMAQSVHDILVFEHSPQESWLPEDDRHRILDLEATLAARREHLARCQMAMEELQSRYEATITPPPFQMTLASASEALSEAVVAELRARREADLGVEIELRRESIYGLAPIVDGAPLQDEIPTAPRAGGRVGDPTSVLPKPSSPRGPRLFAILFAAAVLLVAVFVVVARLR